MIFLRKFMILLILLFFVAWIGLVITVFRYPEAYRPLVIKALQYAVGPEYQFEGSLETEYSLIPQFKIRNFKMRRLVDGKAEMVTQAKTIRFKISLLDLWHQKVNIIDLQIDGGEILIDLDREAYLEKFANAIEQIPKMEFSNTRMQFRSAGRLYPVTIEAAKVTKHILNGAKGHALIELTKAFNPRVPFKMNGVLQLSRQALTGDFDGTLLVGHAYGSFQFKPNSKAERLSIKLHGWDYPAGTTLLKLKITNQIIGGILNFYADFSGIRNFSARTLSETRGSIAFSITNSEFHKGESLKHYSHDNDYVTTMSCILVKGLLGRGNVTSPLLVFDAEALSAKGFGRSNIIEKTVDVTVIPNLKNSFWAFLATPVRVTGGVKKLKIDPIRDAATVAELKRKFAAESPREFSRFVRTELRVQNKNRCLTLLQ